MREIKFRAWDKKMNKMRIVESIGFGKPYYSHEGYPVVNMIGRDCINDKDIIIHRDSHQCELMQYTSLKDKNGKEIYEGDIVEIISQVIMEYVKGKIIFESECYLVKYGWNTHLLCEFTDDITVVGNVYENPELLEE